MTYSITQFQLFHLLLGVYDKLGMTYGLKATATGTTTTVIDSSIPDTYEDDAFVDWYAFFAHDAAGAGAAPEGEIKRVTDYVASTNTVTTDAFSVASAAGDQVVLVNVSGFPLYDVIRLCNQTLQNQRPVPVPDTSLTTVSGQTEYTLPVGVTADKIVKVLVQTNQDTGDSQFEEIGWKVYPATVGSQETLVIPEQSAGYTIKIIYYGLHPYLDDYYDPISEYIPREVAILACAITVASWRPKQEPSKTLLPLLMGQYNQAIATLPTYRYTRTVEGMPQWS